METNKRHNYRERALTANPSGIRARTTAIIIRSELVEIARTSAGTNDRVTRSSNYRRKAHGEGNRFPVIYPERLRRVFSS